MLIVPSNTKKDVQDDILNTFADLVLSYCRDKTYGNTATVSKSDLNKSFVLLMYTLNKDTFINNPSDLDIYKIYGDLKKIIK